MSTSTIFSGASRFSNDFKSVIDRSVAIASLPGDQLRRQQATLSAESSTVTSLNSTFTSLQTALDSLDSVASSSHLTASVSAGGILSTTLTNALEGTYSVNITDLGSATSALSKNTLATVADPTVNGISSAASLTLTVNGTLRTLTPASHSLNDLAAAINSNSDLGVRATILQFGTDAAPSYRLSIQSTDVGSKAIVLNDGADLIDTVSPGTPMKYQLNGSSTELSSNTRNITVAPGLKIHAVAAGSATITVSHSSSAISDAISKFVDSYNSAVDALDGQHGEKAGALAGKAILSQLSQSLHEALSFTSSDGHVSSITDLGLTFNDKGKLSFDSSVFTAASASHPDAVAAFLGKSTDGGFLKIAHDALKGAAQNTSDAVLSLQSDLTNQTAKISSEDDRVNLLRTQLSAQMSAADSLIASLEQQVTYITGLFAAQFQRSN